jgi:hypothetical protein
MAEIRAAAGIADYKCLQCGCVVEEDIELD